jgi:hypothetical protein
MHLVNHAACQHRRARNPVHLHPFEQARRAITQLAAKDEPVPTATCRIVVRHTQAHTHAGDLSLLTGRFA